MGMADGCLKQKRTCDAYDIKTQDVSDLFEYANKEQIERYGFN